MSIADLTSALLGERLSLDEVFARFESAPSRIHTKAPESTAGVPLWLGSAGYENHRDSAMFAARLSKAGVERLIDVRELPISRRRGYAKTALAEALARAGIEYVHVKALGNPKPFRDLYKSGRVTEGRSAYRKLLMTERLDAVEALVPLLREKRCALMCVEHDEKVCHRAVIVQALRSKLGLQLDVAQLS